MQHLSFLRPGSTPGRVMTVDHVFNLHIVGCGSGTRIVNEFCVACYHLKQA
jgi:hypothetical protein